MINNHFFWSAVEVIFTKGIQLLFTILLARILTPEDFGLIAILLVLISIVQVFIDGGLSTAILRKSDIDQTELSTIFYFNFAVSIIFSLILIISSGIVTDFFNIEKARDCFDLISISLIVSSFGVVPKSKLISEFKFRELSIISFVGAVVSGSIGLILAYEGKGFLALVYQYLMMNIVTTVLSFKFSHWMPSFQFAVNAFKDLYRFSFNILISGLIDVIFRNIQSLFIGKIFNSYQLGIYSQGDRLSSLPVINITAIVQRVFFQILVRNINDRDKTSELLNFMIISMALIFIPLATYIAIVSDDLVSLCLGIKWKETAPVLIILFFSYVFIALGSPILNFLKVIGQSSLYLKIEIVKKIFVMVFLLILINHGSIAVAFSLFIANFFGLIVNYFMTKNVSNIRYRFLIKFIIIMSLANFIIYNSVIITSSNISFNPFIFKTILFLFFSFIINIVLFSKMYKKLYLLFTGNESDFFNFKM